MRLDKCLEQNEFGSRKAVKRLLQRRLVRVDGQVVMTESLNVDPAVHEIKVGNQVVVAQGHSYFMLNKPQGTVTAVRDETHPTVIDWIHEADRTPGLYPAGRLDRDTEGLVLITDNGPLGYQLIHPKHKVTKRYQVTVNGALTEADRQSFLTGIVFIGGVTCQPARLTILSQSPTHSEAVLDIQEGKFHQVKKMFLAVDKKVTSLKRIRIGSLHLDEGLAPGMYRRLTKEELAALFPKSE